MMHDLRDALRRLIAKPAFTAMAVMTLALGIGANTAIYGAAAALLVRPLPVPDGDRVVCGLALREGFDPFGTSLLEYAAYREASRAFSDSGLASQRVFTLAGQAEPERVQGAGVMAGYLTALAVAPIAGRALTADDDRAGAPPVAIVSYELWQRRFGGDRAAIGTHLSLDGVIYTVVGVMPPGFDMPA